MSKSTLEQFTALSQALQDANVPMVHTSALWMAFNEARVHACNDMHKYQDQVRELKQNISGRDMAIRALVYINTITAVLLFNAIWVS